MASNHPQNSSNGETTINERIQSVEQLADQFVQLVRQGHPVSIEDYVATYPHLAQQIRELFPTILMMESARGQAMSRRIDGRVLKGPEQIGQLGDFKIVREIGRGGMGIVYEAIQQSLDRRVAVKVLPRNMLSQQQIGIFERESRLAAKLHHTNIVPIHGVGEDNGLHYFVMQLIDGRPLSFFVNWNIDTGFDPLSVEEETALTIRQICRVGIQTARAVQYAHEQGILHRDIKPANLILDQQEKTWVTDFGLAIGHDDVATQEPDDDRTPGTLRYLPPEKLAGNSDSPLGDVYSLGITLIEMVFGRPAFEFQNRQQLIDQVQSGEISKDLFQSRPVPRDLEAILRKATRLNTNERYQSAAEFADDLQRFYEDRPVKARKTTKSYQLSRWLKRDPAMAALVGVIGFLLLTVSVVSTAGLFRVEAAYESERQHRLDAEDASRLASGALEKIFLRFSPNSRFTDTSSDVDLSPLVLSDEDVSMLEGLLVYYQQLAQRNSDDPELAFRAIMAQCRVGEINERLGHFDDAELAYLQAWENIGQLEDHESHTIRKAQICNQLGAIYQTLELPDKAKERFEQAISVLKDRPEMEREEQQELQLELARSHYYLGYQIRPGFGPNSLPPIFFGRNAPSEPIQGLNLEEVEKAISILEDIEPESEEVDVQKRHLLSLCFREVAADQWQEWTPQDTEAHEQAIDLLETLIADFPNRSIYKYDMMRTLAEINVFEPQMKTETLVLAKNELSESVEIGKGLIDTSPDAAAFRIALVHAHFKLAIICDRLAMMQDDEDQKLQLLDLSEYSYRRAVQGQNFLIRRYPNMPAHKVWQARFLLSLAESLNLRGRSPGRSKMVGRAISLLVNLPDDEMKRRPEVQALLKEADPIRAIQ